MEGKGEMDHLVGKIRSKGIVNYALDFHTHEHFEILLMHGGNCRFLVGNQLYHLQPGSLLMLDGMTVHRAYVYGDEDAYERSVVHFEASWISPLLQELGAESLLEMFTENRNGLIRSFSKRDEALIEHMMIQLIQLSEDTNTLAEAQRKIILAQLLIHITQSTKKVIPKEQTIRDEKTENAEKISSFLFQNYKQHVTIDDVAEAVNLSKSYMSHLFKEVTGFTIMNYLMNYRLSQARNQLIREPDKLIKEVSQENGFESEAHFSRFFKQNIGLSPSRYRTEYRHIAGKGELE